MFSRIPEIIQDLLELFIPTVAWRTSTFSTKKFFLVKFPEQNARPAGDVDTHSIELYMYFLNIFTYI